MSTLLQLGKKCSKIAAPKNFYTGVAAAHDPLPNNILFFHRGERWKHHGIGRHADHHHRMLLIMSFLGSGNIYLDSHAFRLLPGEAIAVFPFQFHNYSDLDPTLSWLFITFETTATEGHLAVLRNTGPRTLAPFDLQLTNELLDSWLNPARQRLLAPHLGLLLERLAGTKARPAEGGKIPFSELLLKVNDLALSRLGVEPLGIEDLARLLNTSESHLRARFREETGRSLGQHLRQLRLQKSCYLLRTSKMPISDVALQCGFDSVYSFSRAFRVAWGVTPKDYRKGKFPER